VIQHGPGGRFGSGRRVSAYGRIAHGGGPETRLKARTHWSAGSTSGRSDTLYLGAPYPWYRGRDQVRVILAIRADKIRAMG
jgi:hypothetical protein